MIGNKTADKITSLGKSKNEEKETSEEEIIIPPEKRQQIINDLRLFQYHIKMEYQKIKNVLGNIPDKVPRFITKKWIEFHDQSEETYNTNKQIRFKTSMLRSDLYDFSDVYIVVKGIVVILKNNAPFISCISEINGVLVENAEDLDIVMTMYNLLEYSKNYSKTSASLWNYYRDELIDDTNDNNGPNKNVINSKSFKYKTSITGIIYNIPRTITDGDGNPVNNPNYDWNKRGTREVEIDVPLKHLENFWNSLNMLLVSCEVSLNLSWSETCVIISMEKRILVAGQPNRGDSLESAALKIKDCKLYVPVVTLLAQNINKLLEQLKTRFKRTIKWNKYRLEMSISKNNNLNYLIDPTFSNVNKLFVLNF